MNIHIVLGQCHVLLCCCGFSLGW